MSFKKSVIKKGERLSPKKLKSKNGHVSEIDFECTELNHEGKLIVKGIIIHPYALIRPILEILKDGE